jgi:uncharacterized protein (TIGR00290 family)
LEKILLAWSGGKDSAMALYEILGARSFQIAALLTTVTQPYDRVSMHGVRRILLARQAASMGFSLEIVLISAGASNEEYESQMAEVLSAYKKRGVSKVAFGDIFLEDLRRYRQKNLARLGMDPVFPLWKRDTKELARSLTSLGFKAITTCVDTQVLDEKFVGRVIDPDFLSELPRTVDSCGENGEYHSFVYDGPLFKNRIDFEIGEKVLRDERFYFCDLVPHRHAGRSGGAAAFAL